MSRHCGRRFLWRASRRNCQAPFRERLERPGRRALLRCERSAPSRVLLGRRAAVGGTRGDGGRRRSRAYGWHQVPSALPAGPREEGGKEPYPPRSDHHVSRRPGGSGPAVARSRRPSHRHRSGPGRTSCGARRPRRQRALHHRAGQLLPRRMRTPRIHHLRRFAGGRVLLERSARMAVGLGSGRRNRDPRAGRHRSVHHVGAAGASEDHEEQTSSRHRAARGR